MQRPGMTLIFMFDLALVALSLKILSRLYLGVGC